MSVENVVAGFQACGIFLFDSQAVLKRIPGRGRNGQEPEDQETSWTDAFNQHLSTAHYPAETPSRRPQQKRLIVSPGKSVTIPIHTNACTDKDSDTMEKTGGAESLDDLGSQEREASNSLDSENEEQVPNSPETSPGDFVLVKLSSEAGSEKLYLTKFLRF